MHWWLNYWISVESVFNLCIDQTHLSIRRATSVYWSGRIKFFFPSGILAQYTDKDAHWVFFIISRYLLLLLGPYICFLWQVSWSGSRDREIPWFFPDFSMMKIQNSRMTISVFPPNLTHLQPSFCCNESSGNEWGTSTMTKKDNRDFWIKMPP